MSRGINKITLTFILLFFGVTTQRSTASESSKDCGQTLNPLAAETVDRLKKSEAIEIENLSCSKISTINEIKPDEMVVSSGRKARERIVCMSNTRSNPCKIELGRFRSNEDPNKVLSEAFDLNNEIDLTQPLEESIERLFVKPSEELRPRSRKVDK